MEEWAPMPHMIVSSTMRPKRSTFSSSSSGGESAIEIN